MRWDLSTVISHEMLTPATQVNMVVGKGPQGYYNLFEAVFMKDNVWKFLDLENNQ